MKLSGSACQPVVQLGTWVTSGIMTSPPSHQLSITSLKPKGPSLPREYGTLSRRSLTLSGRSVVETCVITHPPVWLGESIRDFTVVAELLLR